MNNSRFGLIVLGLFLLDLGYTTYYSESLQSLPTHGPLVALSFVGAICSFAAIFITKRKEDTSIFLTSILISYSFIRGLNFLGRTIRENNTVVDMLKDSNGVFVWAFIIYIAVINYRLRDK